MMKESIKEVLKYKTLPTFEYEADSYQQIDEDEYIPTKHCLTLSFDDYYSTLYYYDCMKEILNFSNLEPPDSDEESDSDDD
jgi:hypothetical protein